MQLDYFWLTTEFGILLEIVGAVYIVLGSLRARSKIDQMFKGFEGLLEIRNIREILRSQARMEFNGFLFLSTGLIMQFIGGLGP